MQRYHEFLSRDGLYEKIGFKERGKYKLRKSFKGRLKQLQGVVDLVHTHRDGTWSVSPLLLPVRDSYVSYEDKGGFEISIDWLYKCSDVTYERGCCEKIKHLCVPAGTSINIADPGYKPRGYAKRSSIINQELHNYTKSKEGTGTVHYSNDNTSHDHCNDDGLLLPIIKVT